jgi:hypothetical protein
MNTMTIPGFTAEASLNRATRSYRTLPIDGQIQSARILPQEPINLPFDSVSANGCIYRSCRWTINDWPTPPSFTCDPPVNICFRRGDAGIF